jgi:hypothetical protein
MHIDTAAELLRQLPPEQQKQAFALLRAFAASCSTGHAAEDAPYTNAELFDELAAEVKSHVHGLLTVLEALEAMRPTATNE